MKAKAFLQKHLGDIILFFVLLFATTLGTIFLLLAPTSSASGANIFCDDVCLLYLNLSSPQESVIYEEERVKELDPSLYGEEVEAAYEIEGALTPMVFAISQEGIAVLSSGCPSQYCVSLGYTLDPRKPIVCAYNHVHVEYVGEIASLPPSSSSSGVDIIV